MSFYQDFKSLYKSYILLFIILLYIIVYMVINWNIVKDGNYFGGEYTRPILISAIIFLMFHMLITWDDNVEEIDDSIIDLPKYKFKYGIDNVMKNNIFENNHINHQIPTAPLAPLAQTAPLAPLAPLASTAHTNYITQNMPQEHNIIQKSNLVNSHSLNNKYRIINKFNNPNTIDTNINAHNKSYSNDSKLSNQNIFISHKNSSKYGLKF